MTATLEDGMNYDRARTDKERIESDYDALITRLNQTQAALGNKAVRVNELSQAQYRLWLAKAKSAVQTVQAEIAVKKVERSEARRVFNGWEPADNLPEEWVDQPDCDGWWWFFGMTYDTDDAEVETIQPFNIEIAADGDVVVDGSEQRGSLDLYRGKWKFLPMPDLP